MRIFKSLLFVLAIAAVITACKKDDVTPEVSANNALDGAWITTGGYVKVDGTDITSDYSNFKITFSTTTTGEHIYSVVNGGHAFENISTDLWSYDGTGFTAIKRGDDVVMNYVVKDGFLTLTFKIADPVEDSGRVSGLFGNFEMKLKKK